MILDRPYQLIIFDADGTLRQTTVPGQPCPNAPNEWRILPHVVDTIAMIPTTTAIGLASNQAGVAAGFLTETMACSLLWDLYRVATAKWPHAGHMRQRAILGDMIRYCPHAIEAGCICRKPSPEMIFSIMRAVGLHIGHEVLYVGDMASDQICAQRAGIDFAYAQNFFHWPTTV